jgi:hypothetical protein
MEWSGAFQMNKGLHTMIFSKVGGKYASNSLFLGIRRHAIDADLSLAFQEVGDSIKSGELKDCEEDHDDHDHDHDHEHRSLSGACIHEVKPGAWNKLFPPRFFPRTDGKGLWQGP